MSERHFGLEQQAQRTHQGFVLSEGDRNRILAVGLVASTLYLVGVFVAGLVWHSYEAVLFALATSATIYASAFVQFIAPMSVWAMFLTGWSVAFGIAAGASLIW